MSEPIEPTDDEIATHASKLFDLQKRNEYLQQSCRGDAKRIERIKTLIAESLHTLAQPASNDSSSSDDDATSDIGSSNIGSSSDAADGSTAFYPNRNNVDGAGTLIAGKYKLVTPVGEGGMGTVWIAEQREPVRRSVALKLIKKGMDSRAVVARFEAERQALALMDHPNIAKIYDGGVTPAGAPFFVMELVKGVPITDFCDSKRLTLRQRMELFIPICNAIQHAHHKGIIHRDIKPSNVLVTLIDDKPIPKVIDFGVAKATGQALTEHTLDTGVAIVGTPQYMSPEQASFNSMDIDTRSDVYSLGVLLYELLAGSPPFSRKELAKAGYMEILRVIREEEPPRPSTKLSTAEGLPSLSACRSTEPKSLSMLLRNELDWIVMQALEKDRTRRYETANAFAADIGRYLAGEPVKAHPPSRSYRLRKFLTKNRGPVAAALTVAVALVLGCIGTTLGLLEARRQTALAVEESRAKEEARRKEAEQRQLAEQRLLSVRQTISTAVNELPNYLERLPHGAAVQQAILSKMGLILQESEPTAAVDQAVDSSRAWGLLAIEMKEGYRAYSNEDFKLAAQRYRAGLKIAREVLEGKPRDRAKALSNVAKALSALASAVARSNEEDPIPLAREAIKLCEESLQEKSAEYTEAEQITNLGQAWFELAVVQHHKLNELTTDSAKQAANEAIQSANKAIELLTSALKQMADTPESRSGKEYAQRNLASAGLQLAQIANIVGDSTAAQTGFQIATSNYLALCEQAPAKVRDRINASEAFATYGDHLLIKAKTPAEARSQYVENMKQLRKLVDDATLKKISNDRAMAYYRLGLAAYAQGNPEQVKRYFERACLITDLMLREAADSPAAKQDPDILIEDQLFLMLEQAWAGQTQPAVTMARSFVSRYQDLEAARKSPGAASHLARAAFAIAIVARTNALNAESKAKAEAEAVAIFKNALSIGYNDLTYLETDPDVEPLRQIEGFQAALALLKK